MEPQDTNAKILNAYDPKSAIRTALGVIASLLIMGLPVGLTEALRSGGDGKVAMWGFVATFFALICGGLSIRGTLKE